MDHIAASRACTLNVSDGAALAVFVPHGCAPPARVREHAWQVARNLVARWMGRDESSILFMRADTGKQRLAHPSGLWLNCSHAAGCSLLAFSRSGEIGCDIENRLRPSDATQLAGVMLHPEERRYIDSLPDGETTSAFARCWTRKEALLKARGTGFLDEPTQVDVRPAAARPKVHFGGDGGFVLHDAPSAEWGYAAVACRESRCVWKLLSG